jgi:hypothetical protein
METENLCKNLLKICEQLVDIVETIDETIDEAVNIDVEHKGLLEIPKDKKFWEMPLSFYDDLVDKKGYDAIIKGLNNLKVWNKNDDPSIAKKADRIMDALKSKFRPEEK